MYRDFISDAGDKKRSFLYQYDRVWLTLGYCANCRGLEAGIEGMGSRELQTKFCTCASRSGTNQMLSRGMGGMMLNGEGFGTSAG